jgi:hypothetical protein
MIKKTTPPFHSIHPSTPPSLTSPSKYLGALTSSPLPITLPGLASPIGVANPSLIFLIASNVACNLVWLAAGDTTPHHSHPPFPPPHSPTSCHSQSSSSRA